MKTINFSVKEILPSLLDKSKEQTIRPAWKEELSNKLADGDIISVNTGSKEVPYKNWNEKPPRYKVGEKVKIYWNQRSKYEWFCRECGNGVLPITLKFGCSCKIYNKNKIKITERMNKYFNKLLGTAKITEVFKIEIVKTNVDENWYNIMVNNKAMLNEEREDLAKRDGFSSAEKFFQFFDKQYDLSQPKFFWVYRWKYD